MFLFRLMVMWHQTSSLAWVSVVLFGAYVIQKEVRGLESGHEHYLQHHKRIWVYRETFQATTPRKKEHIPQTHVWLNQLMWPQTYLNKKNYSLLVIQKHYLRRSSRLFYWVPVNRTVQDRPVDLLTGSISRTCSSWRIKQCRILIGQVEGIVINSFRQIIPTP